MVSAGLPLGADEQHQAAARRDLLEILLGAQQPADRLADVDDMDQILPRIDVRPHLGVPTAGPMAEVNPRFDQLLDENLRHETLLEKAHRLVARDGANARHGVSGVRQKHSV